MKDCVLNKKPEPASNQTVWAFDLGNVPRPLDDHLFDRGFISFENGGEWRVSPVAHEASMNKMGIFL